MKKAFLAFSVLILVLAGVGAQVQPPPEHLKSWVLEKGIRKVYSRDGELINFNYHDGFNTTHWVDLHEIPERLQKIFIFSEDRNFFDHGGVDWKARFSALYLNIRKGRVIRGASTISEQVTRVIHPRPRTYFSKFIETVEAWWLEKRNTKGEILEFYLNQVPYASQRRGIQQASLFYFDRSLETLNLKEQVALAVLIRSPSALDLYKNQNRIQKRIVSLGRLLLEENVISREELLSLKDQTLDLKRHQEPGMPWAFIDYIYQQESNEKVVRSTLDSSLQTFVEDLLHQSVKGLMNKGVTNGAALVVDCRRGDILAYGVSGQRNQEIQGAFYDGVQVPRQPGSTLKPFLYALAMENGKAPADLILDEPMTEAVGLGVHEWNNYSGRYYGDVSLREALGNSLNIPAIKLIEDIGVSHFHNFLKNLKITTLDQSSNHYGKGLALGNGEISLFELVRAYTALANQGEVVSLRWSLDHPESHFASGLSKESVSLISDILSDSRARRWEFGDSSLFNYPSQTAIKTGTSTAYRDAWLLGYNDDFVVGVWMGNLDQRKMDEITGAKGPAMVVKGIFKKLYDRKVSRKLFLSSLLNEKTYCNVDGRPSLSCEGLWTQRDWFPADYPFEGKILERVPDPEISFPHSNMILALDPRIQSKSQVLFFNIKHLPDSSKIEWLVNDKKLSSNQWTMKPGNHQVRVQVIKDSKLFWESAPRSFRVIK